MNMVISCERPRSIGRAMNTSPLQFIRTRSRIRLLNTIISRDEIRDISEAVYSQDQCPPKGIELEPGGPLSLQFEGIDCGATVINAKDTGSCCGWSEIGLQYCTKTAVESISTHGTSLFGKSSGSKQWFYLQGHSHFLHQIISSPLCPPPPKLLNKCTIRHVLYIAPTQYFLIIPLLVIYSVTLKYCILFTHLNLVKWSTLQLRKITRVFKLCVFSYHLWLTQLSFTLIVTSNVEFLACCGLAWLSNLIIPSPTSAS